MGKAGSGRPSSSLAHALERTPPDGLVTRELVPAQPGFLIAIDGFLTDAECERLIAAADASELRPSTAAYRTPKKNEAYLDRESGAFVDEPFSSAVWARLRPSLPDIDGREPVGLHGDGARGAAAQFKFYRYQRGHRFGAHVDQSWKGGEGEETEYTLLIYLNTAGQPVPGGSCDAPLVGGDTIFHASAKKELARVRPTMGTALLHAHGRRCLMHEGEEVLKGCKCVLRADVMYRRKPRGEPGGAGDDTAPVAAMKGLKLKSGRKHRAGRDGEARAV